MLIKVLSNFLLPILLDRKREENRSTLGKKTSFKAAFSIFLFHNFFENAFLHFPLHLLIVSSSFCFFEAELGIDVFGKDNARKSREDNLENTSADTDGGTGADNPGTRTNVNAEKDNPYTTVEDPSTATNNSGIAVDNPSTETDVNARADDLGIVANNKARAASFFALRFAFSLLASSSELVTVFLPSSLPSSSSTTLQSILIMSYSVTLIKQGALSSRYFLDEI